MIRFPVPHDPRFLYYFSNTINYDRVERSLPKDEVINFWSWSGFGIFFGLYMSITQKIVCKFEKLCGLGMTHGWERQTFTCSTNRNMRINAVFIWKCFMRITHRLAKYLLLDKPRESITFCQSLLPLSVIVLQPLMSLSLFCRHKRRSIQCKSNIGGEDDVVQPVERKVEVSSVQRNAALSAQPAQHTDRSWCQQIHF